MRRTRRSPAGAAQHAGFQPRSGAGSSASRPRLGLHRGAEAGENSPAASLAAGVSRHSTEAPLPKPHGQQSRRSRGGSGRAALPHAAGNAAAPRAPQPPPATAPGAHRPHRRAPARPGGERYRLPGARWPGRRRPTPAEARRPVRPQPPHPAAWPGAPAPTSFYGAFSSAGSWSRPGRRSCAAPGTILAPAPPPPGRPTCCRNGAARHGPAA